MFISIFLRKMNIFFLAAGILMPPCLHVRYENYDSGLSEFMTHPPELSNHRTRNMRDAELFLLQKAGFCNRDADAEMVSKQIAFVGCQRDGKLPRVLHRITDLRRKRQGA